MNCNKISLISFSLLMLCIIPAVKLQDPPADGGTPADGGGGSPAPAGGDATTTAAAGGGDQTTAAPAGGNDQTTPGAAAPQTTAAAATKEPDPPAAAPTTNAPATPGQPAPSGETKEEIKATTKPPPHGPFQGFGRPGYGIRFVPLGSILFPGWFGNANS